MPRTQKYAVTESLVSLALSQQTTASRPDVDGTGVDSLLEDHRRIPRGGRGIPFGWLIAAVFGAISLTFILCVQFVRLPGIPESRPFASEKLMQKKGFLKVYPFMPDNGTAVPGIYSLPLPLDASLLVSLEDVLNGYPQHPGHRVSCYVSSPSYSRPCHFDREWLGEECRAEDHFGYRENNGTFNPCVLVRIEESEDWKPVVYRKEDVDDSWRNVYDPTFVSMSCALKKTEEKKKTGPVQFFPSKGFPVRFFPATDFDRSLYLSPAVLIRFRDIQVEDDVTFECWLRAANAYQLADSGQMTISFVRRKPQDSTAATGSTSTLSIQSSSPVEDETLTKGTSTVTEEDTGLNLNRKN
ncbi:uncharacterized protein LOC111628679 [Centruroides sculpturatus]|uniref:uncharacterized protein LOC111628679 n=1 Tax=Centruroides sculpturatus TaxID=218467 RepID=UPI000C6CD3C4|nr:uncharacterized protein LOC111628679 [Centruroides sculpturatus]